MKVIMIPVANRPESVTALKVASDLAVRLDGNIMGCHLRPHRDEDKGYKPRGLPLFGSANPDWLDELNTKSTKSAAHAASQSFEKVVTEAGLKLVNKPRLGQSLTATWQERVGSPDRLMAILGPVADISVISRPAPKGNVGRMFLLAALMHTGRPVLLLPQKQAKPVGRRIAIAWNQSAEVSRIVSAMMPMLQQAEAVTILVSGSEGRVGPRSSQLQAYLRCYNVDAKVLTTPGKDEQAELMDSYGNSESDLMLMGAYSRSRFRELVFGGMTEHMLWKANIPLVIQHTAG